MKENPALIQKNVALKESQRYIKEALDEANELLEADVQWYYLLQSDEIEVFMKYV